MLGEACWTYMQDVCVGCELPRLTQSVDAGPNARAMPTSLSTATCREDAAAQSSWGIVEILWGTTAAPRSKAVSR